MHGMGGEEMRDAQIAAVARPAHERPGLRVGMIAADEMACRAGHIARDRDGQDERER